MSPSDPFLGPKLKVDRAKSHLRDLEEAIQAFFQTKPYELVTEKDLKTREDVHRIRVHKCVPSEFSIIIGDIVHNLRSALDQMVCALVRANGKQVSGGNGFPIAGSAKRFEEACVGKFKNVPSKANRLIRRLKPYQGGNKLLWTLSGLDNLDKHNSIVPVAAGRVHTSVKLGLAGLFLSPEGTVCIGGGPPGSRPLGFEEGQVFPAGIKTVAVLYDNCEIYRSRLSPSGFEEEIQADITITFGKTAVTDNEAITELLEQLVNLVERTIDIMERRII